MSELGLLSILLGGIGLGITLAAPGTQIVLCFAAPVAIVTGYFLCAVDGLVNR